jgi:hypothetical protein
MRARLQVQSEVEKLLAEDAQRVVDNIDHGDGSVVVIHCIKLGIRISATH